MKDKIVILTLLLIVALMLSMTIAPSLAFVYPDGSQDNLFEIYGPRIDKILVKKYAGLDPEMQALQNGEIDFTDWALTKTWIDTFAVDPDVRVLGYGGEVGYYEFNFNHNGDPYLGNPDNPAYVNPVYPNPTAVVSLRQAFSHLIDRVALAAGPGEGLYDPIFTPIPAYMTYWIHPDIKYGGALEEIAYPPSVSAAAAKLTADGFLTGGPEGKRYWDLNADGNYDAGEELNLIIYARMDKLRKGAADALCAGLGNAAIQVKYTRYDVTGGQGWQKVMVEKNYHMYTCGWIYIGPDPDYLYDLYHWDNYYHPEDPANFGAISKHDPDMQNYLEGIRFATNAPDMLTNTLLFQEQFAATASEIPLASTSAPKAYNKWYTGGNNGVPNGDAEDKYRSKMWTNVLNEKGQGEGNWFTTLNAYPVGMDFGDGNMIARMGWKEIDMPQTLNPMYSSWYWEYDVWSRIYDSLGARDPMTKGPVQVPYLADSWTVGTWFDPSDNVTKTEITITIRPDVVWSDGHPFDVDDVIYTFVEMPPALRAKGCPDVWWQPTLDQIAGFYKLDDYTVQVLMKVNAMWAMNWVVGNIIVPKHIWQPLIADPAHTVAYISGDFSGEPAVLVGTGPFLFVENTPNTVLMVRNPLYHSTMPTEPIKFEALSSGSLHGILTEAIVPSTQITPRKIHADYNNVGHARITVPVANLDTQNVNGIFLTIELVKPDQSVDILQENTNLVLTPGQVALESFDLNSLGIGEHTLRVTVEIVNGTFHDWVEANQPSERRQMILGPRTTEQNFTVVGNTTTILSVDPSETHVTNGFGFSLDVKMDNVTDLYAFDVRLYFNTTLLQAVQLNEGPFLRSGGDTFVVKSVINATEGYVRFASTLLSAENGVNGTGMLFSITFATTEGVIGNCSVTFGNTVLSDSQANPIDHAKHDGTVIVSEVQTIEHPVTVNQIEYIIQTVSSSTVSTGENFVYDDAEKTLDFNVTGPQGTQGFCDLVIPKELMSGTFAVLVNGMPVAYIQTENATHCFLHFTYNHSTDHIEIVLTIPGDLNGDRVVDIFDLVIVAVAYDSTPGGLHWNPVADARRDGLIDIFDIVIVAKEFGNKYS